MPVVRFAAWLLASWLWCAAASAQAVQGYVLDDHDVRIPLTHVVAVWLDGAETGEPPSVRVALTDRPVAAALLEGLREPEILHLADRGGGMTRACDDCLRRGFLVGHLAGRIAALLAPSRRRVPGLLALDDEGLVAAAAIRERSIAGSLYGICARSERNRPLRMFLRLFLRTNSS